MFLAMSILVVVTRAMTFTTIIPTLVAVTGPVQDGAVLTRDYPISALVKGCVEHSPSGPDGIVLLSDEQAYQRAAGIVAHMITVFVGPFSGDQPSFSRDSLTVTATRKQHASLESFLEYAARNTKVTIAADYTFGVLTRRALRELGISSQAKTLSRDKKDEFLERLRAFDKRAITFPTERVRTLRRITMSHLQDVQQQEKSNRVTAPMVWSHGIICNTELSLLQADRIAVYVQIIDRRITQNDESLRSESPLSETSIDCSLIMGDGDTCVIEGPEADATRVAVISLHQLPH